MKKFIYSFSLICGLLLIVSCGSDDDGPVDPVVPVPTSDFSFEITGKTVAFTSTSSDAASYEWDFGDTNSSTEASPTHTYEGNGSYVAKLTVTNATGTDEKQAVLEIINITIDGTFDEWDDVEVAISPTVGTITSVKFENLENNKLFVYVEGVDTDSIDLTPLTQMLINVDNDRTTGAGIDWLYFNAGEDVLIEGSVTAGDDQAAAIFPCEPCDGSNPGNWNWGAPTNEDVASFIEASEMKSIPGGLAYELSIDLTALGLTVADDEIGIAVLDVSLDTWGPVGYAPALYQENDNPEGTLFQYVFK